MSDIGEGDLAIQCWICPECHDDHAQNRECKTIDQWEAEAKDNLKFINGTDYEQVWAKDAETILALIDLVRKKDRELRFAAGLISTHSEFEQLHPEEVLQLIEKEVLALTEELNGLNRPTKEDP